MRALVLIAGLGLAACSNADDVDERFAAFCASDSELAAIPPCADPDSISRERKAELLERVAEYDEGRARMQESLDSALEAERRRVEAANEGN